jgi:hypothetical protein
VETTWLVPIYEMYDTSCLRLLVQVDSDKLTVVVVDSVIVTSCLHLAFIFQGGWMGQGQVVVATFRL